MDGHRRIRVFVVDEQEVARRGLIALLAEADGITVVGEASTAAGALARAPVVRPDVAVLEVRLPDGDGVSVCRRLRARLPRLQVVMLTGFGSDALPAAVRAGASAYLLKESPGRDLVAAVRTVAAGGSRLDSAATPRALEQVSGAEDPARVLAVLSGRERTLLALLGEGLTNRQIGARMHLAEKTVKNYVSGLLGKLGLQRRTQAAVLAARLRISPGLTASPPRRSAPVAGTGGAEPGEPMRLRNSYGRRGLG